MVTGNTTQVDFAAKDNHFQRNAVHSQATTVEFWDVWGSEQAKLCAVPTITGLLWRLSECMLK